MNDSKTKTQSEPEQKGWRYIKTNSSDAWVGPGCPHWSNPELNSDGEHYVATITGACACGLTFTRAQELGFIPGGRAEFKVGDRVRCINAEGASPEQLIAGREYEVTDVYVAYEAPLLAFAHSRGWDTMRFELAASPQPAAAPAVKDENESLCDAGCGDISWGSQSVQANGKSYCSRKCAALDSDPFCKSCGKDDQRGLVDGFCCYCARHDELVQRLKSQDRWEAGKGLDALVAASMAKEDSEPDKWKGEKLSPRERLVAALAKELRKPVMARFPHVHRRTELTDKKEHG
jgi:hypothetical protein